MPRSKIPRSGGGWEIAALIPLTIDSAYPPQSSTLVNYYFLFFHQSLSLFLSLSLSFQSAREEINSRRELEINTVEFAIVNRVNQPLDGCTRASSIITLIVVTPIIRGMCVYERRAYRVRIFDNDSRVHVSRSSDPMRASVSLRFRRKETRSRLFRTGLESGS